MKLRQYKEIFYVQLPKALVTTFKIRRFDKIEIIPRRFILSDAVGNTKENHIELLIVVSRDFTQRGYNPVRSFVKLNVPKSLIGLFNYQIGQTLTPILYENENDHIILQIQENITVSNVIPEFLNLSFRSVLARIKRIRHRRKNEQSETEAALGVIDDTPGSHGYQSDIVVEPAETAANTLIESEENIESISQVNQMELGGGE